MKNPSATKAFAEEIKKEVLMDLNCNLGWQAQRQSLVDSIKREVLRDLDKQPHPGQPLYPDRDFVEAVKSEVLAGIQREAQANPVPFGGYGYPDRAAVESIKREVLVQLEAEQEANEQHQGNPDPALVQAVKDSVLAEMQMPNYRSF